MATIQPRQPVTLGGKVFETKTQVTEYIKDIIANHPLGPLSGEALAVVGELFSFHPDSETKIGPGIERIDLRLNRNFSGTAKGFWIVRVDGTETDISYKKCLDSERAYRNQFNHACRFAVKEHINAFKLEFFRVAVKPTCALTGDPITPENSHVDHIPPYTFKRIVESFIVLNALNVDVPGVCLSGVDGLMIPSFVDPVLRDKFVQYHNNLASLRVISAAANVGIVQQDVRVRMAA
jgi:hypothetical protein